MNVATPKPTRARENNVCQKCECGWIVYDDEDFCQRCGKEVKFKEEDLRKGVE